MTDIELNAYIDARLERGNEDDVNRVVPPLNEVLSNLHWDANDDARVLNLFGDVFDKLRKARLTNVYSEKEINKIISAQM